MESTTRNRIGGLLALSGALITVTGPLHPRPKGETVSEAAIGMLGAENWVVAHLPQAIGMAVLVVAMLLLRRALGEGDSLRTAATVAALGAAVAVVESVPHILATTEAAALASGGATPLYDTHMWLQAVATPLTGLGVAAVAWVGSRDGVLGPRPLAALGVVGGVGFAFAGPSVLFTQSMLLARLFMFTAPLALWLLLAGIVVVRASRSRASAAVTVPTP